MISRKLFSNVWITLGSKTRFSSYDTSSRSRVCVVGAAGGIGQPLSLLIRSNPLVSTLALYDLKMAVGVAADVSHCDVMGRTEGFDGPENLKKALQCADIVVVPAGMPRKPGQTRDDLFKVNADVIAQVADAMALVCPNAFLAIITNPVNSTVPVAAEVLKKHDVYNPAKLFGVTTLDMVRARKFIGDKMSVDPKQLKIQVIGGHSAETIIPVISDCSPNFNGDDDDIVELTNRIKNGGTEVVEAKAGAGSATLSMAFAGAQFIDSLLKALSGADDVSDIAYVESCVSETEFFASKMKLGKQGIINFPALPQLSSYEKTLVCEALPKLADDIKKGIEHGKAFKITEK